MNNDYNTLQPKTTRFWLFYLALLLPWLTFSTEGLGESLNENPPTSLPPTYTQLTVTSGYNYDVIANGAGTLASSTTNDVDGVSYCFLAEGTQPPGAANPTDYGLPPTGFIENTNIDGAIYQMESYAGDNVLRLSETENTGSLVFSNGEGFEELNLLVTSGSGTSSVDIVVEFNDSTFETFTAQNIPDWFGSNALPVVTSGFGRGNISNDNLENPANNPRLYQLTLPIDVTNQLKQVVGVTVTKTDTGGSIFNLFAATGRQTGNCVSPFDLSVDNVVANAAQVSWDHVAGQTSWQVARVETGNPEPTTGTTVSAPNHVFTNLTPDTNYDFYVRAQCPDGTTFSNWAGPVSFFTGYCDSVPTSNDGNGFTSFDLNGTTFMSGGDITYEDFTTTPVDVTSGQSTPFTINLNTATTFGFTYHINVWVDLNSNLVFESNELLFATETSADPDTSTDATFTIPGTITSSIKRMRVGTADSGQNPPNPCYNGAWGNTADFNLNITGQAACSAPSFFQFSNLEATSVDLSWTQAGSATEWNIIYSDTPGFDPTQAGTTLVDDDGTAGENISGLSDNTTYEFYIQAVCGADSSSLIGPLSFTTPCLPIVPDHLEDFDGTTDWPTACWEQAEDGDPSTGPTGLGNSSWFQGSYLNVFPANSQAARINLWFNQKNEWLISPDFDLSTGGPYELKYETALFHYSGTGMGSDDQVQVLISTDNGTTWQNLLTYDQNNFPSSTGDIEVIDLSAYTGTVRFAYWVTEGTVDDAPDYLFFVENFEVRELSNCPQPTGINASGITDTTADISWTENGSATEWEIVYSDVAGFDPDIDGTTVSDTNAIGETLTGLTSNTAYEVYVRAICGPGDESFFTGPLTFTTACAPIVPDHLENFDGTTDWPTACWDQAEDGDPTTGPTGSGSSNWFQGSYLNVFPANSQAAAINLWWNQKNEWLISPDFDLSTGGPYELKYETALFHYAGTGMGSDDQVQVLITTDNGATWQNLLTYDQNNFPSSTGDIAVIDLSAYTGTVRFAFWGTEGTVDDTPDYIFYVENFEIRDLSTCPQPTQISVDTQSFTSVDVNWTENGSATQWEVIYSDTPGFDPDTEGTTEVVNGTPGTVLTGLTPMTNYEVYIQAICTPGTDESANTGPVEFFTGHCVSVPASQDGTGYADIEITDVVFNNNTAATYEDYTDTPVMVNQGNSVNVQVDIEDGGFVYNFVLWIDLNDDLVFDTATEQFATGASTATTGVETVDLTFTLPASAVAGEHVMRISSQWNNTPVPCADGASWANVADFVLDVQANSCPDPTNLSLDNLTQTTADISWSENGTATEWMVVYGAPGFDPMTEGTTIDVMTNPSVQIPNLTDSTNYEVYIVSDCGGGDLSGYAGPLSFVTPCTAIATLPFTEDFEGTMQNNTGLPTCWDESGNSTDGIYSVGDAVTAGFVFEPHTTFAYSTDDSCNCDKSEDRLMLPMMDFTNYSNVNMTYSAFIANSIEFLTVEVSTDGGQTWTEVYNVNTLFDTNSSYGAWEDAINLDMSAYDGQSSVMVSFLYNDDGTWAFGIGVDDITIDADELCADPSNLTVVPTSATSANVGWTENGSTGTWNIKYGVPGFDPNTTGVLEVDDDGVPGDIISNLNPCDTYDIYVQAVCGAGDESEWVGPITLSTPAADVSNLATSNATASSIDVTWDENGSATEWEVIYGPIGFDPMTSGTTETDSNGTPAITVDNLMDCMEYDFYVKALCANGDSMWVGPVTGSTIGEDPSNLVATTISGTEVDLTWNENGSATEWEIIYGPAGFDPMMNGTIETDDDTMPGYTVDDLATGTDYDFYVRAICANGNSAWIGPVSSTTICADPTDLDWDNVDGEPTQIEISWDEEGDATVWEIAYGAPGFDPDATDGSSTIVLDDDGEEDHILTGLTPDTDYEVHVRAICPDGTSMWIGPINFTTWSLGLDNTKFEGFTYYPNPVKDQLFLKANTVINKVEIYNLLGERVMSQEFNVNNPSMDMARLQSGAYLVIVQIENQTKTLRLLKE